MGNEKVGIFEDKSLGSGRSKRALEKVMPNRWGTDHGGGEHPLERQGGQARDGGGGGDRLSIAWRGTVENMGKSPEHY